MEIIVTPSGLVRCIYTEAIDLASLGAVEINRASHVDPDGQGRWWTDLSPIGGPVLGPFAQRSVALHAEVRWLNAHWIAPPAQSEPKEMP